jgi:hypothetical protein
VTSLTGGESREKVAEVSAVKAEWLEVRAGPVGYRENGSKADSKTRNRKPGPRGVEAVRKHFLGNVMVPTFADSSSYLFKCPVFETILIDSRQ